MAALLDFWMIIWFIVAQSSWRISVRRKCLRCHCCRIIYYAAIIFCYNIDKGGAWISCPAAYEADADSSPSPRQAMCFLGLDDGTRAAYYHNISRMIPWTSIVITASWAALRRHDFTNREAVWPHIIKQHWNIAAYWFPASFKLLIIKYLLINTNTTYKHMKPSPIYHRLRWRLSYAVTDFISSTEWQHCRLQMNKRRVYFIATTQSNLCRHISLHDYARADYSFISTRLEFIGDTLMSTVKVKKPSLEAPTGRQFQMTPRMIIYQQI